MSKIRGLIATALGQKMPQPGKVTPFERDTPTSQNLTLYGITGHYAGQQIPLNREKSTFGTQNWAHLKFPNDRGVAKEHARIRLTPNGVKIEPIGQNRTNLNGKPLTTTANLRVGDVIQIANHKFAVAPTSLSARPTEKRSAQPARVAKTPITPNHHVVVIPTHGRPAKLRRLLNSIARNVRESKYTGKIDIVTVSDFTDSPDSVKATAAAIAKFNKTAGQNITVHHYTKKDQEELTTHLKSHLSDQGIDTSKFFATEKNKVYGGLRNIASLLALKHVTPQSLVTFLDDDVVLKELHVENGDLKSKQINNYFGRLDQLFQNQHVNLAGGNYTADSAGAAFNQLKNGVQNVNHFLERAINARPNDSAENTLSSMWAQGKQLNAKTLKTDYAGGLRKMSNLTDLLSRGKYRFSMRVNNTPEKVQKTGIVVAGNLTMRPQILTTIPFPIMSGFARGEDVLFSKAVSSLCGGVFNSGIPVMHLKGTNGRRILSDAVRDHPVHAVLSYLTQQSKSGVDFNAALRAANEPQLKGHADARLEKINELVSEIKTTSQAVKQKLRSKGWWQQGTNAKHAQKIQTALDETLQGENAARAQAAQILNPQLIANDLNNFHAAINEWASVAAAARAKLRGDIHERA